MSRFEKLVKLLMMVLVTTLVVVLASGTLLVFAQGTGPADALRNPQGWTQIAVGQRVWYAFGYSGDRSQIIIRAPVSPAGSVAFSVWTQAEIDAWAKGGKEQPIGRGSPNASLGKDLVWSGNFNTRGTYYVAVDQKGTVPGNYNLQISGKAVDFPSAPVDSQTKSGAEAVVAAPAVQAVPVETSSDKKGTGPNDALSLAGTDWTSLAVGQRVWYAFQYSGDKSQIIIRLAASPRSAVAFSVWTQADVDAWGRSGKQNPVGRGSTNASLGNDLVWSGNFNTRGTYYVVVEQKGASAGNYGMQVTGKGVTF